MLSYPVLVVLLLILLTVLLLWYVVRVARKRAAAQTAVPARVSPRPDLANLRWSYASAAAHIEANLASRWRRYRIPWILLLGDTGAGKSTLIEHSGIDRAFRSESASAPHAGVSWNFFNRGVVLDVPGAFIGADAGGGDQPWRTVLHLAEKYRPERSIDGVVLTLSVSDLLAAEHAATGDLAHKAELMHRRLWQAQNRFGIRFPVYVVVTQCDRIAGFSSFAGALPQHMRDGMLGWSNPYDFETGYQSDWAEQGIDSIVQDIFAMQAELLAAGCAVDDPDAFVLFPSALAATRGALRAYLDQIFRPSAYHETFYFRGIYLTGDAGPAARAESRLAGAMPAAGDLTPVSAFLGEPSVSGAGPAREPVFVKELFERKVFAEFGLARVSREALATRNRTVRMLRWGNAVLSLLWAGALVVGVIQLQARIEAYDKALEVIVNATKYRKSAHARNEHLTPDWYRKNTELLLEKMAPLSGLRLWWLVMPGSLPGLTSLHDQIRLVLYEGFQDIVYIYARKGLNVRVSELTGVPRHEITTELQGNYAECKAQPASGQNEPSLPTPAIEEVPEFARLREQVQGMETLEANLAIFDRVVKGESELRDLRALLRYTWGMELAESLDRNNYVLAVIAAGGYVIKGTHPRDVLKAAAGCAFGLGLDRVYSRFFAQNPVLLLSRNIAARISALSEHAGGTDREEQPYADLIKQIGTLDGLLKNPRARWLATSERDLGPAFDDLLQHVGGTPSLGPKIIEQARVKAQAEIEKLRTNIALQTADAVGAIIQRTPEGVWLLAPDVFNFQAALAMLLKQRFMADAEGRSLEVRVEPRTLVRWDVRRLDEAIALAEEQRRYLKDNLAKFPPALQDGVRGIAEWHLGRRMTDLIAKAESIVPEPPKARDGSSGPGAIADMHDFDRAGLQLVRILTVLREIGADSTYEDLLGLLQRDLLRSLLAISRMLDSSELYAVRDGDFSWWRGTKNPAAEAFRTANSQELAELLSQQYGQVEWIAKLSAPLLAIVDSSGMRLDADSARVVRRLRGITREVDRFKNKNPRSSVAELEAFIRTELAEIDGQNCIDKMAPRLGAVRDADFFLERQAVLRQQLYARCVELVTVEATKAYAIIKDNFGRTLAGRFPFSQQPDRKPGGEADLEDVVQFLRLYDRHVKSVLPLLRNRTPPAGATANAGRFLDQMDRVRAFLGPLVPPDDGAPAAGYEIAIEFRVNQPAEVDGNKIIDWHLEVGNQTVKLRDANPRLRWYPGMPITLALRWAKDAASTPVNDGALSYLSVDGKNVSYRFTDPWALVSMLKMHAAGPVDAASRSELRPHTLKFEFATQPVPATGQYRSTLPEGRARVFIRLTVTPGGKKVILSLPVFPYQAPGLSLAPGSGNLRLGEGAGRPGARSGWPDAAYVGTRPKTPPVPPASKAGVFRVTGESRD